MLCTCCCQSIFRAFVDFDFSNEWPQWVGYNFGYTFIILVVPVFSAVIIFKYLLKKITASKKLSFQFVIQFIVTACLLQGAYCCWAILDLQFYDFNYEFTFKNILQAYKNNYLQYLPVTAVVPLILFYSDKWYQYRFEKNRLLQTHPINHLSGT